MGSISDVIASVKPRTATVTICPRGDLLGQHEQLERTLAAEMLLDQKEIRHAKAPAVAQQVEDLEAQIRDASVELMFTAIGRDAWTALMSRHLPNEEQRGLGYVFDPETFPIAAVAASCSSHPMSLEDARAFSRAISDGQWSNVWEACLRANVDGNDPFSVAAFAVLHGSAKKSERPPTTESLEASS